MGGPNELGEVEVFLKNMFNDPCILGIKSPFLRKFVAFMITKSRLKTAQNNYPHTGPNTETDSRAGTNHRGHTMEVYLYNQDWMGRHNINA